MKLISDISRLGMDTQVGSPIETAEEFYFSENVWQDVYLNVKDPVARQVGDSAITVRISTVLELRGR